MLLRQLVCEFLGTAFLLATVVGSGILVHGLDDGNVGVTLLGVAVATGLILYALISMLGGISAHFNPCVTLMNALNKNVRWQVVPLYMSAQIMGAIVGVVAANLMFDLAPVSWSTTMRTGFGQWIGEMVATFGLIGIISCCSRFRPAAVPQAVSAYVTSAIIFTSSTCFANPAVTLGRVFTDTITGIRLTDVPAFVICQLAGALLALVFFNWLLLSGDSVHEHQSAQTEEENASRPSERELALTGRRHSLP